MANIDQIIQDKVVSDLAPLAGTYTIFGYRILNVDEDDLPALSVYAGNEVASKTASFDYDRVLQISITGQTKATTEAALDINVNKIKEDVLGIFLTKRQNIGAVFDASPGSKVLWFDYIGSEKKYSKESEDLIGAITIHFDAIIKLSFPDVP